MACYVLRALVLAGAYWVIRTVCEAEEPWSIDQRDATIDQEEIDLSCFKDKTI